MTEIILGVALILSILSNMYFVLHSDKKIKEIVYFHGVSDEIKNSIAVSVLRKPSTKRTEEEPDPEDEMDYGNIGAIVS